jgi:hypothetical protein
MKRYTIFIPDMKLRKENVQYYAPDPLNKNSLK